MPQPRFFDLDDRFAKLDGIGDPLVKIRAVVDWEGFRPILDAAPTTFGNRSGRMTPSDCEVIAGRCGGPLLAATRPSRGYRDGASPAMRTPTTWPGAERLFWSRYGRHRGGLDLGMGERDSHLRLHVETYAGHRADESPRAFVLGARRVEIVEELDRWLDPQHRYFKVRGDDGDTYILPYDVPSDAWELTLFSAGGRGPRLSSA